MELLWHSIEVTPIGLLLGWLYSRYRRKKDTPPEVVTIPPNLADGPGVMILTAAPIGFGDKPPKAVLIVRHGAHLYPSWCCNERGWVISYTMLPIGKRAGADKTSLVDHPDPEYRGQASEGVRMEIHGCVVTPEHIEAVWASICEKPSYMKDLQALLMSMGIPATVGLGMGKRRVAYKVIDKLLQKWNREGSIETVPGTHMWRVKETAP